MREDFQCCLWAANTGAHRHTSLLTQVAARSARTHTLIIPRQVVVIHTLLTLIWPLFYHPMVLTPPQTLLLSLKVWSLLVNSTNFIDSLGLYMCEGFCGACLAQSEVYCWAIQLSWKDGFSTCKMPGQNYFQVAIRWFLNLFPNGIFCELI